ACVHERIAVDEQITQSPHAVTLESDSVGRLLDLHDNVVPMLVGLSEEGVRGIGHRHHRERRGVYAGKELSAQAGSNHLDQASRWKTYPRRANLTRSTRMTDDAYSSYLEAVEYIESFLPATGSERWRRVLDQFGNPQEKFRSVHVAGTSGKGSVALM